MIRLRQFVSLLFLLLFLPMEGQATPPKAPIEMRLTGPALPAVEAPLPIVLSVTPRMDAPQLRISFHLPEGVRVIDGAIEQVVSMDAGETRLFTLTVNISNEGEYRFIAGASIEIDAQTKLSSNADLLITIGKRNEKPTAPPQKRFRTKEGDAVME